MRAARLFVHPNTVSYRVNQAETILGRSIDVDTLELSVALALLPTLPRAAAGVTARQAQRAAARYGKILCILVMVGQGYPAKHETARTHP